MVLLPLVVDGRLKGRSFCSDARRALITFDGSPLLHLLAVTVSFNLCLAWFMIERDPEHPIWDVHDLRRTARLSVKCFCARLRTLERQNMGLEITIAASASSSALAGFAFWKTSSGETAWQVLAAVSAVLAVAKPFLKLPDKIKHLERLATGYRAVEHDLGKIEILARQRGTCDKELKERFAAILERMNSLVEGPQEYGVSNKLRRVCQDEVDRELPHDRFYVPKEI